MREDGGEINNGWKKETMDREVKVEGDTVQDLINALQKCPLGAVAYISVEDGCCAQEISVHEGNYENAMHRNMVIVIGG